MLPKNKSRIPEAFCKAGYAAFLHTETAVKREEDTMKEISIQEFEGLSIGQAENKAAATGCGIWRFAWKAWRKPCASLPRRALCASPSA